MFLSYDTIGYLKGPDIALVKDVETGTVAVRKKLRAELLGVYERLKSVEQANLPRVYETEEYEGECFAYYEYIEGETLEDIVHEGTYTIAQAEEWMEQLCAAMGALHAMQPCVVHRDIKPENIIISNEGILKLIDLGAARLFKGGKLCDTEQIGTRGYAAPEQYGFNQSDARTDIYAAGTVLHVLMARFGEAAKSYNAVAARCTQLEPQNRYQSAKAMKTALRMAKYKKHIQNRRMGAGHCRGGGVCCACLHAFCKRRCKRERGCTRHRRTHSSAGGERRCNAGGNDRRDRPYGCSVSYCYAQGGRQGRIGRIAQHAL